jgi:lysyl-tRNA synthetase class I
MNAFFQRLFSRILPITLMAVGFTLLVKLANIIDGTEQYSQRLLVSEVIAEETSEETTDAEEAEATEEVAEGEEGEEAEKPKKSSRYAKDQAPNFSFTKPKVPEAQRFTDAELELLQSLSERREELEKRTKEVELQESLLQATEKRIDAKLGEMKTLKSEVERILAESLKSWILIPYYW